MGKLFNSTDKDINLDNDGIPDVNITGDDSSIPIHNIDYKGNRKPTFNIIDEFETFGLYFNKLKYCTVYLSNVVESTTIGNKTFLLTCLKKISRLVAPKDFCTIT